MDENKIKAQKEAEREQKMRKNLDRANVTVGLKSEKGMDTYAGVLAVISLIIAVIFFINASVGIGFIFVGVSIVMILLVALPKIIAYKKSKK